MRKFRVHREITATIGKVGAGDCGDILVAGIAVLADAGLPVQLQAFEIVLEEIDDARDRVRTVDRRIAARHDIDPVDQVGRQRVDVDGVAVVDDVGGNLTPPVDQDEGARPAQTTKIQEVQTTRTDARRRVLRAERTAQLGQVVQDVADRDTAALEDFRGRYGGDRNGGIVVGATDARAGDEDFLVSRIGLVLARGDRGRGGRRICAHLSECRNRQDYRARR
jgi:hypothetical protein